jgi:hypothetical protein
LLSNLTEINLEVLGTFFYRKKKALLPLAKASLSACRPLCRCVGSKPPKRSCKQFKTLGLCPKPYSLFEKSEAKTLHSLRYLQIKYTKI